MCHYITAVLPANTHLKELAAIAHKHHRLLEPLENPSLFRQLKPGEGYFFTTRHDCDCGTTLGCAARYGKDAELVDWTPQLKKLRAQGWSETKIARWLRDKRKAGEAAVQVPQYDAHWNDDWFALLAALLGSGHVAYVGLLLHWYSGPLSGRIELRRREPVKLSLEALAWVEEDVLYEFHLKCPHPGPLPEGEGGKAACCQTP